MKSSPLGFIKTKLSQFINDENYATINDSDLVNYVPSNETFTTEQFLAEIAKLQDNGDYVLTDELKTKLSQFIDDSNYVKTTVANLNNYYNKEETYDKTYITTTIQGLKSELDVQIFDTVDSIVEPKEKILYFVKKSSPDVDGSDVYDEYLCINGQLERFGSTKIKMNDYYTKEDITNKHYVLDSALSEVAKSGSYTHIKNAPIIPQSTDDLTDGNILVTKSFMTETLLDRGNALLKRISNYSITGGTWVSDDTCPIAEFTFKTEIPLDGITETDWKVVDFFTTELLNCKICPIVSTGTNKIIIWANENIAHDVVIDSLDVETISTINS